MAEVVQAGMILFSPDGTVLDVLDLRYNPKEFTLQKGVTIAEIAIPGLDSPLHQFMRGGVETLTVEIFCDSTDDTAAAELPVSVTEQTDRLYQCVKVNPESHTPPIVEFSWGPSFPGDQLGELNGSLARRSFTGLVSDISQRFTLFAEDGTPLRALVTLTILEYRPLEWQIEEIDPNSPDRTHVHLLNAGDELWSLAERYYGRAERWRVIADHNRLNDPRRLPEPGTALEIPPLPERVS